MLSRLSVKTLNSIARLIFHIEISKGSPPQANPGEEGEAFNKRVDMAMYEAKTRGGNCTVKTERSIGTVV
ncbi:MAG: hypothetical protein COX20_11895 [Desulfobacterales bacterium CG23_combo_of_CG06-09_8_20_14_all_52_9]|nr:MAG: hypothetical protein COX20_11895 [Desulfobacterales bacterium CG23_combo_of_CG06-09_8_20_14_all_52_9]